MAPRRLVLGLLLIALALIGVAVLALVWPDGGGRLVLAALGMCAAGRGIAVLGSRDEAAGRPFGAAAVGAGAAAIVVAALSGTVAGWVLLAGVPVLLLAGGLGLAGRAGGVRRAGWGLLAWTALVTALLVADGVAQGWDRAAGVATAVGALAVAVLGVFLLVGAANARVVAAQAAPARPAGCAGCACGGGGCAALG